MILLQFKLVTHAVAAIKGRGKNEGLKKKGKSTAGSIKNLKRIIRYKSDSSIMEMKIYYKHFAAAILTINAFVASAKDYTADFFGIKPGSTVLNTRAIQFGIDYISQNGGGKLVFPPGKYLTRLHSF